MKWSARTLACVATVWCSVGVTGGTLGRSGTTVGLTGLGPDERDSRRQELRAYRAGGLQAAARVTGAFRDVVRYPTDGGPESLEELVAVSDLVIVGSTGDNVCRPTIDGRRIVTIYDVAVESVLKGRAVQREQLSLILLGGQVGFPDGSWARLDTPGFSRPTPSRRRVFFLHVAPAEFVRGNEQYLKKGVGYVPSAGPLGIYDLSMSRGVFVHSAGNYRNRLADRITKSRMVPNEFIAKVAAAIGDASR